MSGQSHPIAQLLERDTRYKLEAYQFVRDALTYAQDELGMGQQAAGEEADETQVDAHLTGQQLCEAIRQLAIEQFGLMARVVLGRWGVHKTSDFGGIVYNLIEIGMMEKSAAASCVARSAREAKNPSSRPNSGSAKIGLRRLSPITVRKVVLRSSGSASSSCQKPLYSEWRSALTKIAFGRSVESPAAFFASPEGCRLKTSMSIPLGMCSRRIDARCDRSTAPFIHNDGHTRTKSARW